MIVSFSDMPDHARLWVYSTARFMEDGEEQQIAEALDQFLPQWTAHSKELKSSARIDLKRHVIIAVDESSHQASGCSIDSCVHFLQRLGKAFHHDFFDRLHYTYVGEDHRPFLVHHHSLSEAYSTGIIDDQTLFANPLVKNIDEYRNAFLQPLASSFQYKFIEQKQKA
jgi:hypothetical protein